ncbi:MAG: hypothetical protein H6983_19140 [Ectothiorhodospiraceae bacterium]|nr:hypothetical protein [Ectothiorhodospiraceae bacterium]
MSDDPHAPDPRLIQYLERMSSLIAQNRDNALELGALRSEAKSNGYNTEVLNFLTQIRGRFPRDNGAEALNLLIRYALATGSKVDLVITKEVPVEGTQPTAAPSGAAPSAAVEVEESEHDEDGVRTLLRQIAMGIAVSVGLLWLLI